MLSTTLPTPAPSHSFTLRLASIVVSLAALFATLGVIATPAEASVFGDRVVAEAAKHRGKPYSYGATGPSRFDCSGFTLYVFSRFGKRLPHSSAAQYDAPGVRKIANTSKQKGDLIFMRNSSNRITHVGIYAGNGAWWVAPKTGDVVKLQKLYSSRYSTGRVS